MDTQWLYEQLLDMCHDHNVDIEVVMLVINYGLTIIQTSLAAVGLSTLIVKGMRCVRNVLFSRRQGLPTSDQLHTILAQFYRPEIEGDRFAFYPRGEYNNDASTLCLERKFLGCGETYQDYEPGNMLGDTWKRMEVEISHGKLSRLVLQVGTKAAITGDHKVMTYDLAKYLHKGEQKYLVQYILGKRSWRHLWLKRSGGKLDQIRRRMDRDAMYEDSRVENEIRLKMGLDPVIHDMIEEDD